MKKELSTHLRLTTSLSLFFSFGWFSQKPNRWYVKENTFSQWQVLLLRPKREIIGFIAIGRRTTRRALTLGKGDSLVWYILLSYYLTQIYDLVKYNILLQIETSSLKEILFATKIPFFFYKNLLMPKIIVAKCGIYCSVLRSVPKRVLSLQISLAAIDQSIAWASIGKSSSWDCSKRSKMVINTI